MLKKQTKTATKEQWTYIGFFIRSFEHAKAIHERVHVIQTQCHRLVVSSLPEF